MDINKINAYIRTVADDAYKSEKKKGVFKYQMCRLDDVIMLDFETGFDCVDRRITYRLMRNFEKNFGCKLFIGNRFAKQLRLKNYTGSKFCLHNKSIDINHTIAYCRILGEWRSINCYYKTEETAAYLHPDYSNNAPYDVLREKMKELVKDPSNFEGKEGWDEYSRAYERLYGFTPRAQEKLWVYPEQEFIINLAYPW